MGITQTARATLLGIRADHHYLGRYSIEKLLLFDQYRRTTSKWRVAFVLLGTPLPTVFTLVVMDVVPMNHPSAGASGNSVAIVRSVVSHVVMTFFTLLPLKQALSLTDAKYSFRTIALIACCAGLTIHVLCVPLAFGWRYPVPFQEMIGLPVWGTAVCVFNAVFAYSTMRRLWRRRKLQLYVPIIGVQVSLFYFFLSLSVGFAFLSFIPQAVMIVAFPLMKMVIKHHVWKYARRLDDISTDVTICMLEVSGSLYQTVCIESVASPWLGVVIMLTDIVQAVHEVRAYVKVDYLGDGQRTITTALKIVASSVAATIEERGSAATGSTADAEKPLESARDAGEAATSTAMSTWHSQRHLTRTARSFVESLASLAADDDDEFGTTHDSTQPSAAKNPPPRLRGVSVYMPPKILHERQAKGKRRRRLLDLDLDVVQSGSSGGRNPAARDEPAVEESEEPPSDAAVAAAPPPGGRVLPVPPLLRTKSSLAHERRDSASILGGLFPMKQARTAVVYDASASYTDLTTLPESVDQSPQRLAMKRARSAVVFDAAAASADLAPLPAATTQSLQPDDATVRWPFHRSDTFSIGTGQQSSVVTESESTGPWNAAAAAGLGATRFVATLQRKKRRRIVIDGVVVKRRDQARVLEQTLQLLFTSEVLLFAEYMEVVIPVLYTMCIGSEWLLPNRRYNLLVRDMSAVTVDTQVWTAAVYALLEVVSLLGMYWVMRRKYGVSAWYQLAFVLERYWMTLQGKLVGSFIVVFNAVSVHQGTDFSFRFDYADRNGTSA